MLTSPTCLFATSFQFPAYMVSPSAVGIMFLPCCPFLLVYYLNFRPLHFRRHLPVLLPSLLSTSPAHASPPPFGCLLALSPHQSRLPSSFPPPFSCLPDLLAPSMPASLLSFQLPACLVAPSSDGITCLPHCPLLSVAYLPCGPLRCQSHLPTSSPPPLVVSPACASPPPFKCLPVSSPTPLAESPACLFALPLGCLCWNYQSRYNLEIR